jgi:hypothetical protein
MLVYGDAEYSCAPRLVLLALERALRRIAAMPPGLRRHAALAEAFLEAAALAQGLADADFARRGDDAPSAQRDGAMALVLRLAKTLGLSWQSGFARLSALPRMPLLPGRLPDRLRLRQPEGFAFYALYPEAFLQAAAASGLGPGTRVIGLRSIGLPLAAMVAAGLGAAPPLTLRPTGHPFRRQLALSPAMTAALAAPAPAFAIVDEGPGLSGSSVAAVAEALLAAGHAPQTLHLFPGHAGPPGPEASATHRVLWQTLPRQVTSLEALLLQSPRPEHRLAQWMAPLTGPAEAPLQDLTGGAWRSLRYGPGEAWPPVDSLQERRKFLLRAGGRPWLLKFAGLGRAARGKVAMARALAAAGLAPACAGLRHGFLAQAWETARGLDQQCFDTDRLYATVLRYLAFRDRHFPAGPAEGASPAALWDMACHNTGLALGAAAGAALRRRAPALTRLAAGLRRCRTDGRMQPWEWLCLPDGRLLKADALDHHAAHDLVGCQDIAWDVAGAELELGLDGDWLLAALARAMRRPMDAELLDFYRPCYLAFRLGARALAAESHAHWPEEAARLRDTGRLEAALQAWL